MDPHFNFSLRDDAGKHLSWLEAAQRTAAGQSVAIGFDGFPPRAGYDFASYEKKTGVRLADLLSHVTTGPYLRGNDLTPTVVWPAAWDGVLRYKDGTSFPALAHDGVHIYLHLAKSYALRE